MEMVNDVIKSDFYMISSIFYVMIKDFYVFNHFELILYF
jgi:hypothetical protein